MWWMTHYYHRTHCQVATVLLTLTPQNWRTEELHLCSWSSLDLILWQPQISILPPVLWQLQSKSVDIQPLWTTKSFESWFCPWVRESYLGHGSEVQILAEGAMRVQWGCNETFRVWYVASEDANGFNKLIKHYADILNQARNSRNSSEASLYIKQVRRICWWVRTNSDGWSQRVMMIRSSNKLQLQSTNISRRLLVFPMVLFLEVCDPFKAVSYKFCPPKLLSVDHPFFSVSSFMLRNSFSFDIKDLSL